MAAAGAEPEPRGAASARTGDGFAARSIVLAFVAVVSSFLAATTYAALYARRIDALSDSIANVAGRGIEHLAAARASLRVVLDLTESDVRGGEPLDVRRLGAAVAEARAHLDTYLALPLYADEGRPWTALERAAAELSEAASHVVENAGARATTPAAARLHGAAERVLDAAALVIEVNARNGRELADGIKGLRQTAIAIGIALDVGAVLVAIAAFAVVRREVRRAARLQRAHEAFLERRGEELESFAGRIAHDVRNPLSAARLASDLALRTTADAHLHDLLERAVRNLNRAEAMIEALFEFARAGAAPEPGARTRVAPVVEDLVSELRPTAAEAGVALEVEPFPDCEVACRPGALACLLANLVRNALKYMEGSATRRIAVRVLPRDDRVRVEVEDGGPGIPPDLVGAVFEPYVRGKTERPGLGLGLATVKKLAEGHGGAVGVRSRLGEGTLFWFELPTPAARAPGDAAAAR